MREGGEGERRLDGETDREEQLRTRESERPKKQSRAGAGRGRVGRGTHAHILRDAKLAAAKVNAEVDESASKQTYRHTYHIKHHIHPTHISPPPPKTRSCPRGDGATYRSQLTHDRQVA